MTTTNTMKAKCGHNDLFGYFANTYCKACADKGYSSVVQPTQQYREASFFRIWMDNNENDKV